MHLTERLDSKVGKRANVDLALEIEPSLVRAHGIALFRAPNGVVLAREVPRSAIVGLRALTRRARAMEDALRAELGLS